MTATRTAPYADLHVHTTRSDGSLDPEAVPTVAARAGLSVVAITDHDVGAPFAGPTIEATEWTDADAAPAGPGETTASETPPEGADVTLVAGIELRVEPADGEAVDLLGYGLRRTSALESTIDRIQQNRRERGRAIVDCVADRLDIDLDVSIDDGFGRPHVARAIDDHPDTDLDYQEAFDDLIGSDGPCYVSRELPSFERGRRLLADACDVVALAHPLRYRDPSAALDLASELDAVERFYPYGRTVDTAVVERAIERHDLLATGGSDAHGDRLGLAGLDRAQYDRLAPPGW
ncbi:putative metal-dependent phosphoesterase, PHP family [Halovivax ruber XH-70]|uniref:Putative metal-dependent phosphoesterase, PHP family n=1 Tax=Halovivax ruber (strain DSM 18193 / JCM 13892 / XH-70) TaxID=797302 RepID=L0ICT0_HALRX|nr:PHP domain-containing protein [Halovivax ruber]AGB17345.1 putative metal-dependent phosphoesterase, PHP family [Halovivax ruber XH-70]